MRCFNSCNEKLYRLPFCSHLQYTIRDRVGGSVDAYTRGCPDDPRTVVVGSAGSEESKIIGYLEVSLFHLGGLVPSVGFYTVESFGSEFHDDPHLFVPVFSDSSEGDIF